MAELPAKASWGLRSPRPTQRGTGPSEAGGGEPGQAVAEGGRPAPMRGGRDGGATSPKGRQQVVIESDRQVRGAIHVPWRDVTTREPWACSGLRNT